MVATGSPLRWQADPFDERLLLVSTIDFAVPGLARWLVSKPLTPGNEVVYCAIAISEADAPFGQRIKIDACPSQIELLMFFEQRNRSAQNDRMGGYGAL